MKEQTSLLLSTGLLAATALLAGCKTVARENIISVINTGFGATISENPQTELYEIKVGYIRSQYYSVPTGKTVEKDEKGCCDEHQLSNKAQNTPDVVSGISMKANTGHLIFGMNISENFAVGKTAVMSPAAVAMYVSQAENATSANAAAMAAQAVSKAAKSTENIPTGPLPEAAVLLVQASHLRNQSPANKTKAEEFVKLPENGGFSSWDKFVESNPGKETLEKLIQALK